MATYRGTWNTKVDFTIALTNPRWQFERLRDRRVDTANRQKQEEVYITWTLHTRIATNLAPDDASVTRTQRHTLPLIIFSTLALLKFYK
ncbi:unnamed protein product [Taenia asiatica]|uniref:Uncharacterized protein n=1 Tax=Taenia asiatica TaxID=60517 RepID=A0A0R3W9T7_TAEAS|nr:unnamed protein product [Taenia asiatica]